MTEDKIPIVMAIAALSGCLAGLFALRSWAACAIVLAVAIGLNILGCTAYGYAANIAHGATFTSAQILGGFLLALPGLAILLGLPAIGACALIAWLSRPLRVRISNRRGGPHDPS